MQIIDTIDTIVLDDLTDVTDFGDADETMRFSRLDVFDEEPTDPDATSIYDLTPTPPAYLGIQRASAARRRLIHDTIQGFGSLHDVGATGWDGVPELRVAAGRR